MSFFNIGGLSIFYDKSQSLLPPTVKTDLEYTVIEYFYTQAILLSYYP